MRHLLVVALILGVSPPLAASASAQTPAETPGAERYRFQTLENGVLRLDSQTGSVSLCASAAAGFTCRAAPDDRAALEAEISRLETENATLRAALADRSAVAPPPVPPAPIPPAATAPPVEGDKPAAQEQAGSGLMGRMETAWRHLLSMMARLKGA